MRRWTPEERERQAMLIRTWKPWERSTGPTTEAGKAQSSRNADKPESMNRRLRELKRQVREVVRQSREIFGPPHPRKK